MVYPFPLLLVCMCVCVCLCVCVRAISQKRLDQWTNLPEIFTQNAYGATDVSFGVFDPLDIVPF